MEAPIIPNEIWAAIISYLREEEKFMFEIRETTDVFGQWSTDGTTFYVHCTESELPHIIAERHSQFVNKATAICYQTNNPINGLYKRICFAVSKVKDSCSHDAVECKLFTGVPGERWETAKTARSNDPFTDEILCLEHSTPVYLCSCYTPPLDFDVPIFC